MDKTYVVLSVDKDGFICCSRCSMTTTSLNSQLAKKNRIAFYKKKTLNPTLVRRQFLKYFGKMENINPRSNYSVSLTKNRYLAKIKLKQLVSHFDRKLSNATYGKCAKTRHNNIKKNKSTKKIEDIKNASLKRKRDVIDLTDGAFPSKKQRTVIDLTDDTIVTTKKQRKY